MGIGGPELHSCQLRWSKEEWTFTDVEENYSHNSYGPITLVKLNQCIRQVDGDHTNSLIRILAVTLSLSIEGWELGWKGWWFCLNFRLYYANKMWLRIHFNNLPTIDLPLTNMVGIVGKVVLQLGQI